MIINFSKKLNYCLNFRKDIFTVAIYTKLLINKWHFTYLNQKFRRKFENLVWYQLIGDLSPTVILLQECKKIITVWVQLNNFNKLFKLIKYVYYLQQ